MIFSRHFLKIEKKFKDTRFQEPNFRFQGSDLSGFTALHYASWYCRERIAQNLLIFDIDPNQSGTVNDRPLHFGK